jgi:protein-L-isoaspartate(D-aspartate) O-methyltransferase
MANRDPIPSMDERREALLQEFEGRGIHCTEAVRQAFLNVPRHLFVPGVYLEAVYRDNVIVTKRDRTGAPVSASTQPSVMAQMLNALDVRPGQHVLEIGTGTGYNAALLADLEGEGGQVTSLEIDDEIADAARAHLERAGVGRVQIVHVDGARGHPEGAPYDRIIATASAWDPPVEWEDQLAPGGLLDLSISFGGIQVGAALERQADGRLISQAVFPLVLLPLRGEACGPERSVQLPGSSMHVRIQEGFRLDEVGIHTLLSNDQEIAQLPLELDRRNLGMFSYYLLFHQPPHFQFVTYQVEESQIAYGLTGIGWGVMSPTSACLVPYGDQRVVHLFGGSDAYLELVRLAQAWVDAGQPGLESAHLEISPAGRKPATPPEGAIQRVFVRPSHTLVLWLDPEPAA